MIELDAYEKELILTCKGHKVDVYPFTGAWHNTLKPFFTKIYGWNPDEDNNYQQYLQVIFNKLLQTYLKIIDEWSNPNAQLLEIFNAAFYKSFSNNYDLPIERAITKICGLIQCNRYMKEDGTKRYELDLD